LDPVQETLHYRPILNSKSNYDTEFLALVPVRASLPTVPYATPTCAVARTSFSAEPPPPVQNDLPPVNINMTMPHDGSRLPHSTGFTKDLDIGVVMGNHPSLPRSKRPLCSLSTATSMPLPTPSRTCPAIMAMLVTLRSHWCKTIPLSPEGGHHQTSCNVCAIRLGGDSACREGWRRHLDGQEVLRVLPSPKRSQYH